MVSIRYTNFKPAENILGCFKLGCGTTQRTISGTVRKVRGSIPEIIHAGNFSDYLHYNPGISSISERVYFDSKAGKELKLIDVLLNGANEIRQYIFEDNILSRAIVLGKKHISEIEYKTEFDKYGRPAFVMVRKIKDRTGKLLKEIHSIISSRNPKDKRVFMRDCLNGKEMLVERTKDGFLKTKTGGLIISSNSGKSYPAGAQTLLDNASSSCKNLETSAKYLINKFNN